MEVDLSARLVHTNLVRTIEASSVRRDAVPRLNWELQTVAEGDERSRSASLNSTRCVTYLTYVL